MMVTVNQYKWVQKKIAFLVAKQIIKKLCQNIKTQFLIIIQNFQLFIKNS